jgi:hypothetical protein
MTRLRHRDVVLASVLREGLEGKQFACY